MNLIVYTFLYLLEHFYGMSCELIVNMPQDFKKTVGDLREHFSDEEADEILSSPDYLTANQKILVTLMSHVRHSEEIVKLWNILSSIKDAPHLPAAVESFKKSELYELTVCLHNINIPAMANVLHKETEMLYVANWL